MKTISNSFDQLIAENNISDIVLFYQKFKNKFNLEIILFWKFHLFFTQKGKVQLAHDSLIEYINLIVLFKRIPALKKIELYLHKTNDPELWKLIQDSLLKFQGYEVENYFNSWHLQSEKVILLEEILLSDEWALEQVKKIYTFMLQFSYDQEMFILLNKKMTENYANEWKKFIGSRIIISHNENEIKKNISINFDYDLINLKNTKDDSIETYEKNILIALKYEIKNKSIKDLTEMAIAFKMLSMNKVVSFIVDEALRLELDYKEKANLIYIKLKSDFDGQDFVTVLTEGELFLENNSFLPEEKLTLLKLMSDAAIKLNNLNKQKGISEEIKRIELINKTEGLENS